MKKIMLLAAACVALAACNKSEPVDGQKTGTRFEKGQEVTLRVSSPDTKANGNLDVTTGKVDFIWENGDKINVTVEGSSAEFTLSEGAGTKIGVFTGEMPESGDSFTAEFPSTGAPDISSQTYVANALPHNMMYAKATDCKLDESFSLKPQNAALRLNLWGTNKVGKIVVTNTDDNTKVYTLTCATAVTIGTTSSEATPFLIVVPSGNWKFKVEVYNDTDVKVSEFLKTSDSGTTDGQILNMPAKYTGVGYVENGYNYGNGIEINGIIWAPVNCGVGYNYANPKGLLYQWGRKYGQSQSKTMTGDDFITTQATSMAEGSDPDKKDKFYIGNECWFKGNTDKDTWLSTYNPCPDGWRVPTQSELTSLIGSTKTWTTEGSQQGYLFGTSPNQVFLPAAGERRYTDGVIINGTSGCYWSSVPDSWAGSAKYLFFYNGDAIVGQDHRSYGCNVRCVNN